MKRLIIHSLQGEKRAIDLIEFNSIGRHYHNRIRIPDQSVSKEHCLLFFDNIRGCVLRDLGSLNGTYVNEVRVKDDITLRDGDKVHIGCVPCVFKDDLDFPTKMVKFSKTSFRKYIQAHSSPQKSSRFLPENEISDNLSIREDYEKLRLVYELQRDVGLDLTIDVVLDRILARTFKFLNCDRGVILLVDKQGEFKPQAYKTIQDSDEMIISSTLVRYVEKVKKGIISSDIKSDDRFKLAQSIIAQSARSTIAVPILYLSELLGIMIIDSSITVNAYTEKDLNLITNIANQTAQFIKVSLLHEEIKRSFISSIRTLSAMVDARHPLTAGHSQRVTEYSVYIAKEMDLSQDEIQVLNFAALLHDIGKIGIKDDILLKKGEYTEEERAEMKTHPLKTRAILRNFHFPDTLKDVPEIASHHHEKVDGKGYPEGISDSQLPLLSKIIAIADVFDALTAQRDYPKYYLNQIFSIDPIPLPDVISILENEAGTHFDPKVVRAFIRCLPKILIQHRGGHFTPEYVDDTIQKLNPGLLEMP